MIKSYTKKKKTGATFTPAYLARYVAHNIIQNIDFEKDNINIMDPACGDGELLYAIIKEIPKKYLFKIFIYGVESDQNSINLAENRIKNFPIKNYQFINEDFLELIPGKQQQLSFSNKKDLPFEIIFNKINVIIANPPYVRTQILGSDKARKLAAKFNIKGRIDLYQAFLVAMTTVLKNNGIIGVITSNRFITNKAGESTRKFLYDNYYIIKLVDLGDTKLFDAAVLPAIFFGKKLPKNSFVEEAKFIKIYENFKSHNSNKKIIPVDDIYNIIRNEKSGLFKTDDKIYELSQGKIYLPQKTNEPWRLLTNKERKFIEHIEKAAKFKLSQLAKVKVGIKTNADKVFIRNDWYELPEQQIPEKELLKSIISSKEADRYLPHKKNNKYVLYPHKKNNGKRSVINLNNYPKTKTYIKNNEKILKQRKYLTKTNRQWYEIWVPQDPGGWKQPKIVFPDISPVPKFFYDNSGSIIDGNCYWIVLDDKINNDLIFLLLGLFNSELLTKYHDLCFNNKLYSGRRRYFTQYVENYPIPDINKKECKLIIKFVKNIIFNKSKNIKEKELENLVQKSYNF